MTAYRTILILICLSSAAAIAPLPGFGAEESSADDPVVFQFLRDHCLSCHNPERNAGDLSLADLIAPESFSSDRERWDRIAEKIRSSEMPPPDAPRPAPELTQAVTRCLQLEFERQDLLITPEPGRVAARRLSHAEYGNSIRDLLGVEIDPHATLPPDIQAFGFDNISDALVISPGLIEKYLVTAELAVRAALIGQPRLSAATVHYPTPVRINTRRGDLELPPDLFDYDHSGLSTRHSAHVTHRFPVTGQYRFRLVLNGHRPNQSEPAHPALFIDGQIIQESAVDATDLEGQTVEFQTWVTAGEHLISATYLKNFHGLPANYNGPEPSTRPADALLSNDAQGELTPQDIEVLRKFGTRIKTDAIEVRVDNRFESIDILGPYEQQSEPPAECRRLIFGTEAPATELSRQQASFVLRRFMGRAFRRPVTDAEVESSLQTFDLVVEHGDSPREALATALQGVLVSPHFLYRLEHPGTAVAGQPFVRVSDYELASRLSFFLWSSLPDEELLHLASRNRLREAAVLESQVQRMLRDQKSLALVRNFAAQWLQFRNLELAQPDVVRFPEFEESLRRSMLGETEHFLEHLIRADRSVLDILDADYTFVDERLARFYGISGIRGPEFRMVTVSGLPRGGGVLAHAGILTISSYATRTSPVLRGRWILQNLLNAPPPPPPPSVPALVTSETDPSVSLRQEMERHRQDAACATCHARMDPLGFGLENFNAIGAWREADGQLAVDASGVLPGGRSFSGPQELKEILQEEHAAFVAGMTQKLLIYALGRGLEPYDRPALRAITGAMPSADFRFSELVLGIVRSLPFQMHHPADSNGPPIPPAETDP